MKPKSVLTGPSSASGAITALLHKAAGGDAEAFHDLLPLVYQELRRQAARRLRGERRDHTLQPTALVHEAYLKLIENPRINWRDRVHFFALAAELMRRILVDHARARRAQKRGGAEPMMALEADASRVDNRVVDLLILDDALTRLAQLDPRQAKIIELRAFGGLSVEETAEVIGVSPRTVKADWRLARAWLTRELGSRGSDVQP